ncbi:unnamed protein product, partial [Brassica oleracea]
CSYGFQAGSVELRKPPPSGNYTATAELCKPPLPEKTEPAAAEQIRTSTSRRKPTTTEL